MSEEHESEFPGGPPADVAAPGAAPVGGPRRTGQAGRATAIIALTIAVFALVLLTRSGTSRVAPVRVPIELRGWPGGPTGVLPVVRVRIGDSRPVPVPRDTGSTGLVIQAKDLPAGSHVIRLGNLTEKWGGGNVTEGRQALAHITLGGLATSHPVAMGIHQHSALLSCPGRPVQRAPGRRAAHRVAVGGGHRSTVVLHQRLLQV